MDAHASVSFSNASGILMILPETCLEWIQDSLLAEVVKYLIMSQFLMDLREKTQRVFLKSDGLDGTDTFLRAITLSFFHSEGKIPLAEDAQTSTNIGGIWRLWWLHFNGYYYYILLEKLRGNLS